MQICFRNLRKLDCDTRSNILIWSEILSIRRFHLTGMRFSFEPNRYTVSDLAQSTVRSYRTAEEYCIGLPSVPLISAAQVFLTSSTTFSGSGI